MNIQKTIGTQEQQILIDRVGEKLAEISGYSKLAVKGFIRKNLDIALGNATMKDIADDPSNSRMKIFIQTAKKTGEHIKLGEQQTLDAIMGVYEAWKKEFNRDK